MTDTQRHALRTAASLLLGHFRDEAAKWLREAGDYGRLALAQLEEEAPPMTVRDTIMRQLQQAPNARR